MMRSKLCNTFRTSRRLLNGNYMPAAVPCLTQWRSFHSTKFCNVVKPYVLADIGEGITECQIISWLVKPGDQVQQFDPICEVQSDKATVEITSRFDGTIRKLNYEVDAMAAVGSSLLDIEIDDAGGQDPEQGEPCQSTHEHPRAVQASPSNQAQENQMKQTDNQEGEKPTRQVVDDKLEQPPASSITCKNSGLVIPSVRHMVKEHNLDIADIEATGRGGRVLKEDVQRHLAKNGTSHVPKPGEVVEATSVTKQDQIVPLTPIQHGMFQSMTRSLSIPHFLFTQIVDLTALSALRRRFSSNHKVSARLQTHGASNPKLSALPFIMKSLSKAAEGFPVINSSIKDAESSKPQLILKRSHNIGIAMDTPKGLVVPVVRNVQDHSIISLAAEIERLGALGREGRLSPADMQEPTMVVSNIGSIGGHVVAPIIMPPNVLIVGVGRSQQVPVFQSDEHGEEKIVKREQVVLSWSADHRVLDGATMARCAQEVATWLEECDTLGLVLR